MEDLKPSRTTIRTTDVTASGSHFLKDFAVCPSKGARQHFYPHPNLMDSEDNATGLRSPYSTQPLILGSALHSGIEEWYRSRIRDGVDTGEPNLDRAIEAIDLEWANRGRELPPGESIDALRNSSHLLLRRYHDYFGPKGHIAEFPETRVLCDSEGEPWIERHFEIDLGAGFTYTARIDLVVEHAGFLCVMDHKSSKASFHRQLLAQAELEAQFTGQLLCLYDAAPDLAVNGILLNVLIKDAAKTPPFVRSLFTRSAEQLKLYRLHTRDLFERISIWRARFQQLLEDGIDTDTAFNEAWPMDGLRHGGCYQYYRKCQFWDLCQSPATAGRLIPNLFRPAKRVVNETSDSDI